MSYEPSANESIAAELAKRETEYGPWFADRIDGIDDAKVRELATEYGFEQSEQEDEEADDDYAERLAEEVREFIGNKRDDDNKLDETVLGVGVSVTVQIRVELSTGGPADYLTADLDISSGTIDDVRYHFAPWFDHADVLIDSDSPLYHLVERYASVYAGMSYEDIESN